MRPAVTISAAAEIGHPHQLRNHAHHLAATAAAEHAHDVAAAHAHPPQPAAHATCRRRRARRCRQARRRMPPSRRRQPPIMPPKPPPPFSIIRLIIGPMVCIIMAEAALAHLGFHHFEHRRHLGHHVAAASAAEAGELGLRRHRGEGKQQQQRGCLAHRPCQLQSWFCSSRAQRRGTRRQPDARGEARARPGVAFCEKDHVARGHRASRAFCIAQRRLIHLAADIGRDLVRQHVDDPDQPAARCRRRRAPAPTRCNASPAR